jgi:PAP2 superfamily
VSVVEREERDGEPAVAAVPLHRRLPGGHTLRDGRRLYWWGELLAVGIFYGVYSFVRNLHHGNAADAFRHARDLMNFQRDLGINHEQAVQAWALGSRTFIIAANYFYGSLHFIVTAGVMIYLYRKWTDDYPLWRNTLAIATALALIGFAFFPLAPPRMFPQLGFVDTLVKDPAFWSFNSGAVNKISNQFAAMPSVHCTWALWCACALIPRLRHRWAKLLAAIYPVTTVAVIVVTANHYVLDAAGGFFVLGVGYLLARTFTRAGRGQAVRTAPGTTQGTTSDGAPEAPALA